MQTTLQLSISKPPRWEHSPFLRQVACRTWQTVWFFWFLRFSIGVVPWLFQMIRLPQYLTNALYIISMTLEADGEPVTLHCICSTFLRCFNWVSLQGERDYAFSRLPPLEYTGLGNSSWLFVIFNKSVTNFDPKNTWAADPARLLHQIPHEKIQVENNQSVSGLKSWFICHPNHFLTRVSGWSRISQVWWMVGTNVSDGDTSNRVSSWRRWHRSDFLFYKPTIFLPI